MPGLLNGLLPYIYGQGDRLKRNVNALMSDPLGSLEQTAGNIQDKHREQQGLLGAAFADPQRPFSVTDRAALGSAVDNTMAGPMGFAPAGMILYHGSNSAEPLRKITDSGAFGGIFASPSRNSALSHGDSLYRMTIPDEKVMPIGGDVTRSMVRVAKNNISQDPKQQRQARAIADMAVNGKGLFEIDETIARRLAKALGSDDLGEADWALQRLRGEIAKSQGYKAAAMPDEHGTSYLVFPGTTPRPVRNP